MCVTFKKQTRRLKLKEWENIAVQTLGKKKRERAVIAYLKEQKQKPFLRRKRDIK
jgi:hypothetical protein